MKALPWMVVVMGSLIGGLGLLTAAAEAKAEQQVEQELLQLVREWIDAAVRRDTATVGHILADEWGEHRKAGDQAASGFSSNCRSGYQRWNTAPSS